MVDIMNYKNFDIFSPIIVVLLVILYLVFSFVAFNYHLKELVGINTNTIGIIFLGLMAYIIGMISIKYLLKNRKLSIKEEKLEKITSEKIILSTIYSGIVIICMYRLSYNSNSNSTECINHYLLYKKSSLEILVYCTSSNIHITVGCRICGSTIY